jgi:hypothetical protein
MFYKLVPVAAGLVAVATDMLYIDPVLPEKDKKK